MLECPLFREFCERNKTAKLKGVNIDTLPTLIGITHVLELCGLNYYQKKNYEALTPTTGLASPFPRPPPEGRILSEWVPVSKICVGPSPALIPSCSVAQLPSHTYRFLEAT